MLKAIFQGQIKDFNTKVLVSGDIASRLTVETQDLPEDTLGELTKLQKTGYNQSGELYFVVMNKLEASTAQTA